MAPSIDPSAVVCREAIIQGNVTVGPGCIIHPKASIIADEGCSVVLGPGNIVEEGSVIHGSPDPAFTYSGTATASVIVGAGNIFKVGCTIHAANIGSGNIFETKCVVEAGVVIPSGCIVGAKLTVTKGSRVKAGTVLQQATNQAVPSPAGNSEDTHKFVSQTVQDALRPLDTLQQPFLTANLPKFHHLQK